jgi:hypothetical protein
MTNLTAISSETHRATRVAAARATLEHAGVNIVSVIPREFPRLLANYPIFFGKSSENGQFEPAALLGFQRGENLFLIDGLWDAPYVPLQIQRQPFALLPRPNLAPGEPPSLDVALDMSSSHVQTHEGERLFQDDGQPTQYLQNVTSMLSALVSGSREAYAFTAKLAELNLLEPVRIDIEFVDRTETKLEGLYWVAAAKLKELTAAQLAELRDLQYLEWLYFQMASVAHVSGLVSRKNRRIAAPGVTTPGAVAPSVTTPAANGGAASNDPR